MLGYHLGLALKSLRGTPALTALMMSAMALGISACIVTLTIFDAASKNPIWWKSDRLYAVTLDSWDPNEPADPKRPDLPPSQLTYKDSKYLMNSGIPERTVVMHRTQDVVLKDAAEATPYPIATRITTADFFAMFDVPFIYGAGWSKTEDTGAVPVIVLSKEFNEKLFGGANSVGRAIRWNEREFRVAGVVGRWSPLPKFYDLTRGAFDAVEEAYVPFGWTEALGRFPNGGHVACWRNDPINSLEKFLQSDCVWLQVWVELKDRSARDHLQLFLDAYWADERKAGRFPRARNNRLTDVSHWLVDQEVVQSDTRLLLGIAFAFLAVCLLNTVGMMLAKFLRGASAAGVRRALGATRGQIFSQYMVEAALLAGGSAIVGLGLAALGLAGMHALYARGSLVAGGYQELTHINTASVIWTLILAVIAALAAGVYPAWQVGRLPPAQFLKSE